MHLERSRPCNLRNQKRSFWFLTWKMEGRPPRLIPAEEHNGNMMSLPSVSVCHATLKLRQNFISSKLLRAVNDSCSLKYLF